MTRGAQVELRDLQIPAQIGTYGPLDVVPDRHLLDLTLTLAPELVLVSDDQMALVFDYDPLIAEIGRLASEHPYQTQERLVSRIAEACAEFDAIEGLEICLRKQPVLAGTGSLGLRLMLGADDLAALRRGAV